MKPKLLLSILLFGNLTFSNAQEKKYESKSRPTDFEYLSAPDSLGLRHQLKTPNIVTNKKTSQTAATIKLPYPIIFIHGLNSKSSIWDDTTNFMDTNYLFTFGGRFDFCLNYDNIYTYSRKIFYPNSNADIALFTPSYLVNGDYYYVNFDVATNGSVFPTSSNSVLSNQSAIAKQGYALREAIYRVMEITGRDKVILVGHSMGGLCAREYLQNPENWTEPNVNHHIAKLITTGTPHMGSDAIGGQIVGVDYQSEALRDLKNTYFNYSDKGIFLFGGYELDDGGNYYNVDVNCDGNGITEDLVIGLNQKNIPTDLDYSCIIGTGAFGLGDIAVKKSSANINNVYPNLTQNIFESAVLHNFLPQQNYQNMRGLDEPNDYSIAYGVEFDKMYLGFITEQSNTSSYVIDYDDYKFNVSANSQVNIVVNNGLSFPIYARIVNSNFTQIGTTLTINNGNNILSQYLPVGQYYLEIYGNPTSSSYQTPYAFGFTSTLSNPDFTSDNSLKIYPNPTSSKVSFDNSISNFEKVSIANSLGQEVSKSSFNTFINNQEVDISQLPAGVYMLKLSNQNGTKTVKIIKE